MDTGNELVITTTTGAVIRLREDETVYDYVPRGSEDPGKLWRIMVGQSDTEIRINGKSVAGVAKNPDYQPKLYLLKRRKDGDTFVEDAIGPFPSPLRAVAIGILKSPLRSYYAEGWKSGEFNQPDCQSADFIYPVEKFKGQTIPNSATRNVYQPGQQVVAHQCATIVTKVGRGGKPYQVTEEVCPLAIGKRGDDGRSWVAAPCQEQHCLGLAVFVPKELNPGATEDEWILTEAYFKSTSASKGRAASLDLRDAQRAGEAIYGRVVRLTAVPTKQTGNSFVPEVMPDAWEPNPEEQEVFEGMLLEWKKALEYRAQLAVESAAGDDSAQAEAVPVEPSGQVFDTVAQPVQETKPPKRSMV